MTQKYSITPEGATEAAKEIVDSEWTCCHANPATVTELAAIILRHAEQSTEETCVHCGATRDVHGLISAAAASCAFESTQSSEGEMRTGMKTPWCLNGHEVLTPGCESCLLDLQKRYNDALRKVQGEGELREACIVCGCTLMPPERTEPPHCMDCALPKEHYRAWGAG